MDIQIPGFDIEGEIGVGAMATVYVATQRSLERKVALKIMAAPLAADSTFCERFLREGKNLARLSHPHTVTIHDIGNVGDLYYMAMEYLPNGTLKERVAAGLNAEQGLTYIRQIASALGYAHAQGLVHRDVKPANILFRANGSAVLSDFGIAKSLDDRTQFTHAGFAIGTPNYMSPEQARGLEIDGRADLYALGVILYEMLVGKLPYHGTDALSTALAHLTEPLPELPIHHGRYQHILSKLLAKHRDERFTDAAELIAALDDLPPENIDATQIRPLPLPPTSLHAAPSAKEDSRGLTPVSIAIPDIPLVSPVKAAPVLDTSNKSAQRKGPVFMALLVVAAALGLGIGGYWWSGDDKSVVVSTAVATNAAASEATAVSPAPVSSDRAPTITDAVQTPIRTGVVLVVDTSVSMQPYIDQVRHVVAKLQNQMAERGELDNVSFGLVGFRNNVAKTPRLEYVSKTLITLEQGRDPQRFLELARQVKATTVSSHSFNEDAFAGVMQAINGMDWAGYGGRLILLVSDAGSLRKNDPYSSTQMNEAEVREAALSKQIKIYALHLKTEAGKKNHAFAEQQYRTLTADTKPNIGDLYVSVPGGDVQMFGDRVSEIGAVFADLAHQVRSN